MTSWPYQIITKKLLDITWERWHWRNTTNNLHWCFIYHFYSIDRIFPNLFFIRFHRNILLFGINKYCHKDTE